MRRTRLGLGAAATAAVALLISGCGSGDAGNGAEDGGKEQDGASSSATGGDAGDSGDGGGDKDESGPDDGGPGGGGTDTGGTGGSGGDGGPGGGSGGGDGEKKVDLSPYLGPWAAGMKSDGGTLLVLIFNKDATVSLSGQDVACQGTLKAAQKPAELDMKCRDSGDDFTSGTITELNEKSLTVKWGSGEKAEFLKGAAPAGPPGE